MTTSFFYAAVGDGLDLFLFVRMHITIQIQPFLSEVFIGIA